MEERTFNAFHFLQNLRKNLDNDPDTNRYRGFKKAAVCLLLRFVVEKDVTDNVPIKIDEASKCKWVNPKVMEILYIRRADNPKDRWSGNVAFPGGKQDGNETNIETAIRETHEEIGIDLSNQ
jgi:8-oxo-dGTP pyrophosphatase MutT (NUDIX family)